MFTLLFAGVFGVTAKAETYGELEYRIEDNGEVTITGCDWDASGDIVIPTEINGYPVTSIGDEAFNFSSIESIVIPEGVKSIGISAFEDCHSLKRVDISSSVTSIGFRAFCECDMLESIKIPDGVKEISRETFLSCSSLLDVTIPNSVTIIRMDAFACCDSLKSIAIPEGVVTINGGTFFGCESLESIVIPASVISIDDEAFDYCEALKNVWYVGSQEEYKKMTISSYFNDSLLSATWHFNACPDGEEHSYDDVCDSDCNKCKTKRTAPHSYKETITGKATLNKAGTIVTKCSICGNVKSTRVINKISKVAFKKPTTTYDGTVKKPSVVVTDAKGKTVSADNYTITYPSNMKNVGKYKIKVTFKGNYSGSKTLTYTINSVKASKCSVKLSSAKYTYNGKVKKPTVTVKNSKGKTISSKNYTVSYASGRKNVGKYKVTVKFKGNYSGTKTLYFTISPTTKTDMSILISNTAKIGAKSNKKITYTSSNKKVATVNSKGIITGVKAGTVTIKVKSGTITQEIKVKVKNPSVKISSPKSSMYIGRTLQLTAKTNPSGAKVIWSVNNSKIAKISSKGKLTALGEGTVTVTAKITYKGKTYKNTYKVKISVEYPDVTVLNFTMTDYTSAYAFNIENNGKRTIKVLNRGSVYCDGTLENINMLYIGGDNLCKSVKVSPGKNQTIAVSLNDDMLFWDSDTVWLDVYVEYGGETFLLECRTGYSLLNTCYKITWIKD